MNCAQTEALATLLAAVRSVKTSEKFRALPKEQQREVLAYACGMLDAFVSLGGRASS